MADKTTLANRAQKLQEDRLINFGAVGLAFAGGAFKVDEYFGSVKRFQRNWFASSAKNIVTTTTGIDVELEITIPEDRWCSAGALAIELNSAVKVRGSTQQQLLDTLTVEIERANGKKTRNPLRAYTLGFSQLQDEADEPLPSAGPLRSMNEHFINGTDDFVTPVDFLNPGETIKVRIAGLNGTTIAGSHNGVITAKAFIATYDGVKG